MLGAVVYRLRAENTARLPVMNGRYMHAAFFHILEQCSPELSGFVHDEMQRKPFAVSVLRLAGGRPAAGDTLSVRQGDLLEWRVALLHEELLAVAAGVPRGMALQAGPLQLTVEEIVLDGAKNDRAGFISEVELIDICLSHQAVKEIKIEFLTPCSFRTGSSDYPWPGAEFVFSSLANKWLEAGLPPLFDKNEIREAAALVLPKDWHGGTQRVRFGTGRWTLCFTGDFCYDLSGLDPQQQKIFLLLAQFAVFSGVGRMTGQGLGEVRVRYE